jgi:hypothetical protein
MLKAITGADIDTSEFKIRKITKEAQEFWQKRIGKSRAERLVGGAAESISTMASVAALTRGKGLLPILALGAGVEKTAEEVELGTPRLNAYGAGFAQAATEYFTEKIPIKILQNPGINLFKRIAAGLVTDVPGEVAATATEIKLINEQLLDKEKMPPEQFRETIEDTIMKAGLTTIGLSGGAQLAHQAQPKVAPEGEVLDPSMDITEALNAITIPESQPATVTEKAEAPDTQVVRDDSKSEFPEVASQTNYVNPTEQLDTTPDTKELPDPLDVEPIDVHETEPFKANTWTEVMEESNKLSKNKRKFQASKLWRSFVKGFVSTSGNIEADLSKLGNDGKRVALRRQALAGAHSKALKEVDIAKREIFSGLNTNQKKMFDGYISALRHLELRQNKGVDFKLPGNVTEQALQDYIEAIPEKDLAQFQIRSDKWSQRVGEILDVMTQEGLLTPEQQVRLRAEGKYYVPRQVLNFIDPLVQQKGRDGKTISVRDSGLQSLSETGSEQLVEMDSEMLLEQVYERAFTRIFRNRANLAMLELARTNPDNGIVKEDVRGRKLKSSEMRISAMENGVRRDMIVPLEAGQEWVKSDPILSAGWSNIIGWASGTKILKSMATTLNPEFAITNIPRDLAHIWLTTQEYSSLAPVAAMQMGNDIRQVVGQAIKAKGLKKTKLYNDYIDNGGGTEFLSHQGKTGLKGLNPVSKAIVKLEEIMGVAGESSEILTRLALMNRAMRNGKSVFEATQISRGYLDFSQGGSVAKAVDTAIPFFNAAVQATRGIARAAKGSKALFTAKAFQIGSIAASLYWANRSMYGDEVEDVPEVEQKNNFIIFTPYTFIDPQGQERHYYLRVPKDQGQRAFAAIFEGFARKAMGQPVNTDMIVDSIIDFSPVSVTELLSPTVEAVLGYSVNKDFWRREDIWQNEPVLPQEEYNKYTPEAYVRLGEATGLSPVRMKYAVEQIFTRGNIWTSLVGYSAKQIFDELTPEQRLEQTKELFERKPFIRRVLRSTRPDARRERVIKEEKERIETERLRTNRKLDTLIDAEAVGRTDNSEINEFIKRHPIPERQRLRRRRKAMRRLRDVPNKGYWFDLLDLPPEARATNYWNRWVQLDELGRKELDRQSRKVPGFRSKRFNRSFNKMRRLKR